ncbi:MAG TPA: N-(5'-phosphoribosyl)anthranilate isomerase [Clostridiales bacterium]|nr:N-(5'-phosphoribosyl)anthranilate isomerase [Clostridiales bacterium]
MSETKIKICGLRRMEDIEAVNGLLPDFIGFVFWRKSRRYVTSEQAEALKKQLDPKITAVGVFVDAPEEEVSDLLNRGIIDIAQLHGHEDEKYISRLRKLTEKPLIQAFQIRAEESAEEILKKAESSSAEYVLIDSGMGSGKKFDWDLLKDFPREYFLAGGLDPENVGEAAARTGAFAVDVSSNVETDGKKDIQKMKAFVEAVRKN